MIEQEDKTAGLGAILQWRREEMGFTREDLAAGVGADINYIQALEDNNYAVFPAKIYALGFYRKIITVLDLGPSQKDLMVRFQQIWDNNFPAAASARQVDRRADTGHASLSMFRISVLGGGLILAVFLSILGSRLYKFIFPPSISIREPSDEYFSVDNQITIRGSTQQESSLTVNGREINVDSDGAFDEKIELSTGFNKLEFFSENKFGKTNKVVRYVVVK